MPFTKMHVLQVALWISALVSFSLSADSPGEALFLTPLIEEGDIETARNAARVGTLKEGVDVESYSGYFTVNKEYNSSLFFWFFPAQNGDESAPVLLWLEGGPGEPFMSSLFNENGPYYIDADHELQRRGIHWARNHHVIYLDSPAGTGFSFTQSDDGYARNQDDVARDVYSALIQFFQLFPYYQDNDFYVTGSSYGGKYVPSVSYKIHTEYPKADLKINLQGLAYGNGFTDPENMMVYSSYLYEHGFVDTNQRDEMRKLEELTIRYIQEEQWTNATTTWHELLAYFSNNTGIFYLYNYLYYDGYAADNYTYEDFVNQTSVRAAIHVGDLEFGSRMNSPVLGLLFDDMMKTARPAVEALLEHYRVLIYSGQIDIICAYPLTENYLKLLNFSAAEEYKTAGRYPWYSNDGDLAGLVKTAGNLTEVLIRNAGHFVPTDQPEWALDMITRFTSNTPYYNDLSRYETSTTKTLRRRRLL